MDDKNGLFHTERCCGLECLIQKVKKLPDFLDSEHAWLFRGQPADRLLETTLERECARFAVVKEKRPQLELDMLREFQRRAHHYTENVPHLANKDEWLALMRHHGAPSRLLDFTYSPYLAAYFAFERAKAPDTVAIWAIDATWLERQLPDSLARRHRSYQQKRKAQDFDDIFMSTPPKQLVLGVNPFRLNERLASQKGAFLCPGDVGLGFMDNLRGFRDNYLDAAGKEELKWRVVQYTLHTGWSGEIRDHNLVELDRMNITRTTLFPDLDGFAQSLSVKIITFFLRGQSPSPGD